MATSRNKRKLAAVSRKTPESTRNSRAQNRLDTESTQDYISQVSEEIEGRVAKKLSKEFKRTESRILGALSKLDEFLLNPQVWTCSVDVPETSRNNNSQNRETTGDRSSGDRCPEVRYSSHHSGHLNSPEAEDNPHRRSRRDSQSPSHGNRSYKRNSPVSSHDNRNSRRDYLLLPWHFVRKTKEGAFHKSATISQ